MWVIFSTCNKCISLFRVTKYVVTSIQFLKFHVPVALPRHDKIPEIRFHIQVFVQLAVAINSTIKEYSVL